MKKDQFENEFIQQVMASQAIIHKVCRVYCNNEEQRKDLFQEILIQLWQSYPSFRGDAKFSTWMYKISFNVAIQLIRRQKQLPDEINLSSKFENLPAVDDVDDYEDKMILLNRAIGELSDIEKAIVLLYFEEKSNEEIAEIIGITQNYVRVKMNRIKHKLRTLLKAERYGT